MTGKPKPEFLKPPPAIVKLAGAVARSTGLGVMELTPRVSLTVSEVLLTKLKLLVAFLFNDTATTEISTLPLHDALPILASVGKGTVRLVFVPEVARA